MNGNLTFSVAKPIIKTTVEDEVFISNYYQRPLNFYICNYDEDGNISEVAMEYYIEIQPTQINAPINYKLYRVYSDDKEESIELKYNQNSIITTEPVTLNSNESTTHVYRLEFYYDNESNAQLDDDFKLSIMVDSKQKSI